MARKRFTRATAIGLIAAAASSILLAAPVEAATPTPGAAGLGDRLNPGIGNGGYDVLSYDLKLRYATSDPRESIDGDVTILARATQDLSRFNLDYAGKSAGAVSVNGAAATFTLKAEELVVTPSAPVANGNEFTVSVTHFRSTPTVLSGKITSTGFFISPDGSAMAAQPYDAHRVYPCNDHPRDKATFRFTFDVPAGTEAVANGVETGHSTSGGRSTWTYEMRQPMATELTQLAVGNWDISTRGQHNGVLIRDVSPPSLTQIMQPAFALEPSHLDYMTARVGRYPFDTYGTLVVDADVGFSLETQTLELLPYPDFTRYTQGVWDPTMLHELAHMWFGDSVAPYEWSDLWNNEGHASWYEFNYAASRGQLAEDTEDWPDPQGYATLDELMRAVYAHGDEWRRDYGPVARIFSGDAVDMFSFQVYHGGALVLYALRQKIGAAAFERVERAWVQRYEGKSASTDDYIALATEVSRVDVTAFLRDWLYGTKTPPMPGHPDWTVNPIKQTNNSTSQTATSTTPALRSR